MLVNIKKQSMKEQTIAVQLQSQTTCLCIFHYHLQQNTFKLLQKEVKSTQKQLNCKKKGAAHAKNNSMKKVVKSKVAAQKWL